MDKNCCRVCERREGLSDLFDYINDATEDSLSSKLMQIAHVKVKKIYNKVLESSTYLIIPFPLPRSIASTSFQAKYASFVKFD